jgi:uncharacterized protein
MRVCYFILSIILLIFNPVYATNSSATISDARILSVVEGALAQIGVTFFYDPAYRKLAYPGGDVALETGVCTDVVIRAFRRAGIDLQVLIHEDMRTAFHHYPKNWGLKKPDRNIDHRRVPNLQRFFTRQGTELTPSTDPYDYQPGDVVTWKLNNGLPHIGIVSQQRSADQQRPLIIHNIGAGAQLEDMLFEYEINGHYRYFR